MSMAASSYYTYYFFQSWFHTFLVRGRGYREGDLLLSSLPYLVGACANVAGGMASDAMVRKMGLRRGRRVVGLAGLGCAALFTIAVMLTGQKVLTVLFLSLVYGGITFQQPVLFAVCLDIGRKYAGAVVGSMNTAAQFGGLVSAVAFGYLVNHFGSYDAPFIPMVALLLAGWLLWLKIDASQALIPEKSEATALTL
jgi:MFS family permease